MTARPGYSPAPQGGGIVGALKDAASSGWVRLIVDVVNKILSGKMNAVLEITLTANSATSLIEDARIGNFSGLYLEPLTANAAAAQWAAPYVIADTTTQKDGAVTFNHANNAQTDRTFRLLIIG